MEKITQNKWFNSYNFLDRKKIKTIKCGPGWKKILQKMFDDLKESQLGNNFKIIKILNNSGNLKVIFKNGNVIAKMIVGDAHDYALITCDVCGRQKMFIECKCKNQNIDRI